MGFTSYNMYFLTEEILYFSGSLYNKNNTCATIPVNHHSSYLDIYPLEIKAISLYFEFIVVNLCN